VTRSAVPQFLPLTIERASHFRIGNPGSLAANQESIRQPFDLLEPDDRGSRRDQMGTVISDPGQLAAEAVLLPRPDQRNTLSTGSHVAFRGTPSCSGRWATDPAFLKRRPAASFRTIRNPFRSVNHSAKINVNFTAENPAIRAIRSTISQHVRRNALATLRRDFRRHPHRFLFDPARYTPFRNESDGFAHKPASGKFGWYWMGTLLAAARRQEFCWLRRREGRCAIEDFLIALSGRDARADGLKAVVKFDGGKRSAWTR